MVSRRFLAVAVVAGAVATCAVDASLLATGAGHGNGPDAALGASILNSAPIVVNSRQRLVDGHGREVIFHGTNVVAKGPPYLPTRGNFSWDDSFVAHDMQVMRSLGLNAIRLGAMWAGAEPVRGVYNHSYLRALGEIVAESAEYGIYSLLDMHQDVLADRFCGEGVPSWAAIPNTSNFPWPLSGGGGNSSAAASAKDFDCHIHPWAEYYPTQAVGEAFQNLYSNAYGLADAWAQFWVTVAETVGTKSGGAVLGYELINEPWAGDIWKNILLMLPTVADVKNLQPLYDMAAPLLRAVDPLHAIFFEGVTWDWFNVGFTHAPGGAANANRSVLSYHFYMPPDFSTDVQFAARAKDMARLSVGGFLTEFGVHVCSGCGTIIAEQIMDACDSLFQSWTFWQLKPFPGNRTGSGGYSPLYYDNGSVIPAMAFNLSRTYAQAIAGSGEHMAFDIATGNFELAFTTNAQVTKPETVIYASHEYHYPGGMNVTLAPASFAATGALSWNVSAADRNLLVVRHDPSQVAVGTTITVSISAL